MFCSSLLVTIKDVPPHKPSDAQNGQREWDKWIRAPMERCERDTLTVCVCTCAHTWYMYTCEHTYVDAEVNLKCHFSGTEHLYFGARVLHWDPGLTNWVGAGDPDQVLLLTWQVFTD